MTTKRVQKTPVDRPAVFVKGFVELTALNETQGLYLSALDTSDQVIVLGPSGTGKTYLAASKAANMLVSGEIENIILTRPSVAVGRDLGYFPGTEAEKIAPWAAPVVDVLVKRLGSVFVEAALKKKQIHLAPLSTMRGKSFSNAFIILDEAQNTSVSEIKMFLTRIGENCKVVVNGDIKQSDLRGSVSGLSTIIEMSRKYKMKIPLIEFTTDDIVRSKICKDWIIAFDKMESGK